MPAGTPARRPHGSPPPSLGPPAPRQPSSRRRPAAACPGQQVGHRLRDGPQIGADGVEELRLTGEEVVDGLGNASAQPFDVERGDVGPRYGYHSRAWCPGGIRQRRLPPVVSTPDMPALFLPDGCVSDRVGARRGQSVSFEFFPPKTGRGRTPPLANHPGLGGPQSRSFVSVTYGAGGPPGIELCGSPAGSPPKPACCPWGTSPAWAPVGTNSSMW